MGTDADLRCEHHVCHFGMVKDDLGNGDSRLPAVNIPQPRSEDWRRYAPSESTGGRPARARGWDLTGRGQCRLYVCGPA